MASGPLPGAVDDLTAARIWGIVRKLATSGLVVLADKGYLGEDCGRTPHKGLNKPASRWTPIGLMLGSAARVSAPTPSSSPGASCASSVAARCTSASWSRRSTPFRPAKSEETSVRQ